MMVHPAPFDMLRAKIIAASMFEVRCTGKESHASAFPELGVNAADALTIAQTAIGLLRQHIRSTDRIHGIVTHGGDAPNVVPAQHDEDIAAAYRENSEALGRPFPNLGEWETTPTGSTDMGNISRIIPSIHPMISINSLPAVNHQPEFAAHCVTPEADKALADGAIAMAWTCIDLATNRDVRERLISRA
jgi:metal-dependent amidase/aminoacylase/carboxypeptidase family protein